MKQLLLLAMVLSMLACGRTTGSTCPTNNTLSYTNFGRQFFASYCDRCHAAGQLPQLAGQIDIRAHRMEIDSEAASGPLGTFTTMPDGNPRPTMAERQQLGQWLACGAP